MANNPHHNKDLESLVPQITVSTEQYSSNQARLDQLQAFIDKMRSINDLGHQQFHEQNHIQDELLRQIETGRDAERRLLALQGQNQPFVVPPLASVCSLSTTSVPVLVTKAEDPSRGFARIEEVGTSTSPRRGSSNHTTYSIGDTAASHSQPPSSYYQDSSITGSNNRSARPLQTSSTLARDKIQQYQQFLNAAAQPGFNATPWSQAVVADIHRRLQQEQLQRLQQQQQQQQQHQQQQPTQCQPPQGFPTANQNTQPHIESSSLPRYPQQSTHYMSPAPVLSVATPINNLQMAENRSAVTSSSSLDGALGRDGPASRSVSNTHSRRNFFTITPENPTASVPLQRPQQTRADGRLLEESVDSLRRKAISEHKSSFVGPSENPTAPAPLQHPQQAAVVGQHLAESVGSSQRQAISEQASPIVGPDRLGALSSMSSSLFAPPASNLSAFNVFHSNPERAVKLQNSRAVYSSFAVSPSQLYTYTNCSLNNQPSVGQFSYSGQYMQMQAYAPPLTGGALPKSQNIPNGAYMSHVPSTNGVAGSQTQARQSIPSTPEGRVQQMSDSGVQVPLSIGPRTPAQADKRRLARDILLSLGVPSGEQPGKRKSSDDEARGELPGDSTKKQAIDATLAISTEVAPQTTDTAAVTIAVPGESNLSVNPNPPHISRIEVTPIITQEQVELPRINAISTQESESSPESISTSPQVLATPQQRSGPILLPAHPLPPPVPVDVIFSPRPNVESLVTTGLLITQQASLGVPLKSTDRLSSSPPLNKQNHTPLFLPSPSDSPQPTAPAEKKDTVTTEIATTTVARIPSQLGSTVPVADAVASSSKQIPTKRPKMEVFVLLPRLSDVLRRDTKRRTEHGASLRGCSPKRGDEGAI